MAEDIFLLCSDGLSDAVDEEAIEECLQKDKALADRCNALLRLALDNGADDNVSIVLLEVV